MDYCRGTGFIPDVTNTLRISMMTWFLPITGWQQLSSLMEGVGQSGSGADLASATWKCLLLASTGVFLFALFMHRRPKSPLPLVNPRGRFEFSYSRVKRDFIAHAPEIIERGFLLTSDKPFRISADIGEVIILPPELADEVRNNENLTFARFMYLV